MGKIVYQADDDELDALEAQFEQEERQRVRKKDETISEPGIPVLDCEGADQMVSLFPFVNARKTQEFVEYPQARFRGIILINEGVGSSERFPNVDQKIVFETIELRDKYWDRMKEKLAENGYDLTGLSN